MAVTLPGATPVQNALSQLGALPEQDRARLAKNSFDSIARETSIPANVLMALDEAEGGSGNIQRARENALKLGEAVKAGAKIEDAVTSLAGNPDKGKSILDRSYAIADAIYPATTPAPPPEAEGYGIGTALADVGKKVVAGGVSGLGSVAREAGIVVDEVLKDSIGTLGSREVGKAPEPVEGETIARAGGRAAQGVLDAGADAVRNTVSEEGQKRAKGTNLSGELLSPSTWDFGDDPSVSGLVLNAAEGVGSMIPMVASRGPVGAAIMGGLMAGGEGAENGRQFVIDAARVLDENGEPEIAKLPEYQKLRAAGKSHEQATMDLARVAETEAGFRQSVVGALGGAATNRIFRSAEGWMGTGGRVARAAKKGTAGFFEEGVQEAIEGGAALSGIGAATGGDMNLAEDSFGNFVMGGLSGGAMGAAGGMLFGENEAAAQTETETEAQEEGQAAIEGPDRPLMLPPPDRGLPGPGAMGALPAPDVPPQLPGPTNGGTIFGEGRPGVEPNAIERDPNNPRAPRDEIINGPAQFRPGPTNATADGSGDGAVVAPGGGSFLSASPGAATSSLPGPLALPAPDSGGTIFGAGRPGLEPNAIERDPNKPRAPRDQIINGPAQFRPGQSNATAPMEAPPAGPIDAIARSIKMPEPPPVAPPVRFPEHKPGSAVRLGDPDSGQIFDGVFLGESEQGAHVRIGGREEILAPEVFDMGRDAVAQIEAQQKEAAKAQPAAPAATTAATPVTPAAPPAAPPLATDPDMLIEPIEGNQPQAQQNMGAAPETLPQGNQPTPTVEDIRDRASVLRGVDRNNPPAIPGVSMKWDDRADGFIFSRKHADAVRAAVSGTPAPQPQPKPPSENDVPTAHRRPFIDRVKAWGGINPTGKVAEELRHRGVTSRTAPGLYRRNGYKDMDNIPANEHPDLIGALAFDPSSGYFDQEAIIAAIADEIGGRPLAFGQHAIDQQETRNHWSPNRQADRAASAGPVRSGVVDRESDIRTDDERRTDISRGVMADIQDLGLDGVLTRDEIAAIIDQIDREGGNTRDAIHDTIVRSERDGIQSGSGDSRAAGPLSDIPFGDEGESERFARAAGAVGTEPQGQDSGSPEQAGRDSGVSAPDRAQVEQAAAAADPEPTDAQKEAGNYRKGHILWNGLDLTIENAKGSTRSGKSADGKEWSVTMPAHYGYFKRSEGADGDHVDFYLGDVPDSDYVMIIDQVHADTGAFDEHKVIIGTTARGAALDLYLDGFSDGRGEDRIGNFTETTVGTLKSWLQSSDTSKPTKPLTHPFRRQPIEKAEDDGPVKVGDSWDHWASYDPKPTTKRVISRETRNGEPVYLVQVEGERTADILTAEQVEQEKARDARNLESRKAAEAKDRAAEEKAAKAKADAEDLDGFTDGMTPMQAGKVIAALTAKVNYKGRAISRRDLVREKVRDGAVMDEIESEGEILMAPDETFLGRPQITKTGLDYAKHLIAKRDAKDGVTTEAEPRFPTTLEDIVPKPRAGEGRMTHIYAEYRGQRFYLASVQGNGEGPAAEWRKTYPGAAIYTTDRADGTSINGDIAELDAAVAAQAAPNAETPSPRRPMLPVPDADLTGLPEGYSMAMGNTDAQRGKFAVLDQDGRMVWGWHDTQAEAIKIAAQRLKDVAKNASDKAKMRADMDALAKRLMDGGEPTDADLRMLDLKSTAGWDYISPTVQEVFGISNRNVREAMGDALFKQRSDMGTITWAARTKRALVNAAAWQKEKLAVEALGGIWDGMSKDARTAIATSAGWANGDGNLNPTGRKIVGRSWADHSYGTQVTLARHMGSVSAPAPAGTYATAADWSREVLKRLRERIEAGFSPKVRLSRTRAISLRSPDQVDETLRVGRSGDIEVRIGNSWDALGIVEADELAAGMGMPARFEAVPPAERTEAPSMFEQIEAHAEALGVDLSGDEIGRIIADERRGETVEAAVDRFLANRAAEDDAAAPTVEPGAEGLPQTVIPGAERSEAQAKAALSDRQRLELEARQKQSKIRRLGGNDGDAGPLFGNGTDDLFAAPSQPAPAQPSKPTGEDLLQHGRKIIVRHANADDEAYDERAGRDLRNTPTGRKLADDLAMVEGFEARKKVADAWVLESGRALGFEHLVVLNKDGVPLAIMSGHKSGVSMHAAVWRAAEAGEVAYAVHNHPTSGGPSPADVAISHMGFPVMKIMGHNGSQMEFSAATEMGATKFEANGDLFRDNAPYNALDAIYHRTMTELNRAAWALPGLEGQTDKQAEAFARAIKPAFALVLERLGVITYTGPGVDEITAAGFNFEEIYGQVSGFGRDRLGRAGFNLPAASDREGNQPTQGSTGPAPRERDGADRAAGTDAGSGRRKTQRVPAEAVAPAKGKIEDFGEKIGGARKDVWSGYADRMTEAEALDIGAVPLSQSWPAPDYEKLIEAGVEPWKVGFIRAARDAIPTKPQNAYKVRSWVETVKALRGIANDIMAGEIEESAVSGKLVGTGRAASLIRGQMKLYAAVGHSKSLKGLGFGQVSYSMLAGVRYDPAKSFWEVTAAAPSSAFSNMPKTLARAETEAEAIEAFKKVHAKLGEAQEKGKRKPKFLIYSHNDRKFFTVGVKLGSTYLQLRKVDTVQEARRIIAEESDALEDQLKKLREIPADRKSENAPRVGTDHRGGVDVTAKQFAETFGFRGVEFGNWVEGKRRQEDLNNAYDALMDMAGVLDIPPKAISLNGALGLAFGARGSGGVSPAAAHYEPGKVVINLTKMNGAGSLGHEWFHAVDHHLAKQVQTRTGSAAPIEYLTNNVTPGKHVTGLRGEVADAFIALRHAIGKTELKKRSERIDQTRSTPYWATQIELHARAFESYLIAKLQDQSVSNDYLANVVEGVAWQMKAELSGLGDSYPYLKEDEIEVVRAAFDALFDTIQTRETDKGTDLYQRDMKMGAMAAPEVPSGILRGVSDVVGQILRAHGLDRAVSPKVVRNLLSKSGVPVLGSYRGGEIKVNAGAADPGHVVRHEIIHALRDANLWGQPYGLFTGQEWRALVRAARADEGIRRAVERAYGDLDAAGQAEEMVAEFYADWAADRAKYPPGPILRALERIQTFFRALGAALRGEGFMDAAMVMDRIARGEIGGRGPGSGPGGGVRESRGNAGQTAYQRTPLRLDRALIGGDLASISGHADYQAAKAGDVAAAVRLAKDIVTDDLMQRVRAAIKGHSPMILPVVSIEASGRNKIPAAAAEVLAARLGLDAAQGIVQSNAPRRTSLAGLDRIFASPEFEGEVVAGQEYLILDDTLTQGGTFAALAGHIESGGGRVIGAVALTGKQYSATLQPTPETLSALRAKHGDIEQDFLAATGHGFDSLTESEARYLANFKPAQAVRDRILAERGRGGSREDQGDAAGGQVSREQRDLSGLKAALSRSKGGVLGMLGNLDWKRTPKEAGELFSNFLTDAMGRNARFNILSLVPGQPLFAELGKRLPAAQEYLGLKQAMDADRNKWQARSAAAVDRWTQLARRNPEANAALMDLMHRTTLAQSDPTKDDGWRRMVDAEADRVTSKDRKDRQEWAAQIKADRAKRKAVHDEMRAAFDKLPKDFQKLYADIRDEYSALADAVDAALMENIRVQSQITLKKADREYRKEVARINDEGLTGPARTEALGKANEVRAKAQARAARGQGSRLTQLRQLFEQNRLDGPYFPLARFGNYFVTIRDADKKVVSFSRFESESAQKAWAESAEAKALGKVQTGVLGMSDADSTEVDPRFIAEIEGLLDDAGADRKLMDAVYQRWLETLPDQSIRTSQIHRKGRAGFNKDAVRAFASSMFHGAHQAARLRFGAEMAEALEVAEEQAAESDNPNRAGFVVREMKQRHEFTMNPTNNPWVSKATGLAFVWYLGMSPAAALVNVSQTTIVGVPMMAARFRKAGLDGTIKELTKASADFMRGRGKVTKRVGGLPVMSETWSIENAPNLTQDERKAMEAGYDLGVIDKTQSHDLASVADSGIEYNATREKIMRVIGWGFHHTERFNREVTYLAAYRLARQEGLTHATAVSAASSMVWKTHFDYSNTSKPRAMQGDAAKVFLIFRNFTFNMLFRLFRDTHQAMNGASKEDRREARAQLIGVTLSMMGHAGIRGVWGYGLLTGLLALFFPGDGDDMDEWLQDALLMEGDDLGTAGWNWIMGLALNGVPGHALGLDLTNRIGMPDLFLRSPDRDMEGKDLWAFYVEQFAGPAFGIGGSLFTGASMVADGEFMRGFEKMVPTFARNVIKGGRYATEGVTTYYGDDLVDGLNPWQVLMQMQGFTPAEVAERYDINNRLVRHERRIEGERSDIIREIGDAVRAGEDIPEASIERMREFNARVPEYPITRDNIRNSVQSRNKASARNEMGVGLNPKLNTRLREDRAPALY